MHEFEISESVEDMDEGDLRSTLTEFMEKHEENVEDYRDIESDRDEFSETVEDLEDEVSAYAETEEALVGKFAGIVSDETPMFDAEEVADRFSLSELMEKADAMGAFSLSTEEAQESPDADEGGEGSNTFDEKPDKAPTGAGGAGGNGGSFADEAESDLASILGI